jgi:hypothetical protein
MSGEYFTMFGYDEEENPVVATNVTTTEAKAFAKAKELNGFFLAPQDTHRPSGGASCLQALSGRLRGGAGGSLGGEEPPQKAEEDCGDLGGERLLVILEWTP